MTNNLQGRDISEGISSYYFELCDICHSVKPNWIETKKSGDNSRIWLTCNNCHANFHITVQELDNKTDHQEESDLSLITDRPTWMQEFINDQKKSGSIVTIGGDDEFQDNIGMFNENNETEEDVENQPIHEEPASDRSQIALWSAAFVKEALFGLNPQQWLEEQGGFIQENITLTIYTLSKFSENTVAKVKLSAISCLQSAYIKYNNLKKEVNEALNLFTTDTDQLVVDYANDILKQIK